MKKLFMIMCLLWSLDGRSQSYSDTQELEFSTKFFTSFHIYNKNGEVKIEGVDGSVAKLRAKRKLKSASSSKLDEAKENLVLDTMVVDGAVYVFVKSEQYVFEIDEDGIGGYSSCCSWQSRDRRIEVDFEFDITLEVPKSLNLFAATHRQDLSIDGIDGDLYARNHHDDLTAINLKGNATLFTHHGDIDASYLMNPTENCVYRSHHGDIRIKYQENLSVVASFKSKHGQFYSDFDWSPQPVTYTKSTSGKGTKYEVGNETAIKINDGGPEQSFKTHHGNIYLERL